MRHKSLLVILFIPAFLAVSCSNCKKTPEDIYPLAYQTSLFRLLSDTTDTALADCDKNFYKIEFAELKRHKDKFFSNDSAEFIVDSVLQVLKIKSNENKDNSQSLILSDGVIVTCGNFRDFQEFMYGLGIEKHVSLDTALQIAYWSAVDDLFFKSPRQPLTHSDSTDMFVVDSIMIFGDYKDCVQHSKIECVSVSNGEDNNYKVYVAIGKTKGETKKEISFPDDFDIEVENEKLRLELLKYFEE